MKKIWLIMLAFLVSCANWDTKQPDYTFDYTRFHNEKAAWESLQMDHYRFTGEISSPAYPDEGRASITVAPNKEPEITIHQKMDDNSKGGPFAPFILGHTITEIYASIETQLTYITPSYVARIQYNEKCHFPEQFMMGPPTANGGGGFIFLITAFEDLRR